MRNRLSFIGGVLIYTLVLAQVFTFGCLFIDYGWRGIPVFLNQGMLAWVAFIKGIVACILFLLFIVRGFLPEATREA